MDFMIDNGINAEWDDRDDFDGWGDDGFMSVDDYLTQYTRYPRLNELYEPEGVIR